MAFIKQPVFLKWLRGGLLVAMIMLAYVPAMSGGFIWDDDSYVTRNPTLRSSDGLRKIWFEPRATPQYYPIVFTSFWVQYQLWELQPFPYHFVNVLLHVLNAFLVWRILLHLGVPYAWMAAAVFALHPVHLESVAWITERKNVLSGFFYLSALLVYIRYFLNGDYGDTQAGSGGKKSASGMNSRFIGVYLLTIGLFSCALLSKSVTCSMPAVILLLIWWKKGRISWRDVRLLIPMLLLGILLSMNTVWMEKYHVAAQGLEWEFSILERCLIAGRALWFYAGKLIWPHPIIFIYPRWQIDLNAFWQYLFPLSAIIVVLFLWFTRRRLGKGPLVALLIFGGTLLPALGFIDFYPMRFSFVADHFQYLASIGLISLITAALAKFLMRFATIGKQIKYGLCVSVLLILGALVWQEGYKYKDLETLWKDTITKNPNCWMAHNGLGAALAVVGNIDGAIFHYSEALRLKPDYEVAHYNLGLALEKLGRMADAISHYSKASMIDPGFLGAHYSLGIALLKQGKTAEAVNHYSEVLRINPNFTEAHMSLALAFSALRKPDKAIIHYSEALRTNPGHLGAHMNLGNVLKNLGRINAAIEHFSEALRINPDHVNANVNIGLLLATQGKIDEAIIHYSEALRTNPDHLGAHMNLGNALVYKGKFDQAIRHYSEALRIWPDFNDAQDNLKKVMAAKDKYDEAFKKSKIKKDQ